MKKIALVVLPILFLLPNLLLAQQQQIRGKVTDDAGAGIPEVTVSVKGTTTSTLTGADGSYTISIPAGTTNPQLVFSHVGFTETTMPASGGDVSLTLQKSAGKMDEVVVVGYGTQQRRKVTGAVSSFNATQLDERPVQRVDQALVGQLAGVTVKQTTGIPGRGFAVQVRGTGSISGGNEPLYVLDGFPLSVNSSNTGNGSFATGNPLDNINPNDIESIDVLKDAAAAAIYGSRAANGVVLITTKRGRTGKPKIDFNLYGGYNSAAKKLKMMNGDEWIENATEVINATYLARVPGANINDDRATRIAKNGGNFNADYIPDPRWAMPGHPGLRYIDWQDVITRKGLIQNYQVSASGGTESVKYFVSGNYANTESFVKYVGYKAYSLRANMEVNTSDRLKFGLNVSPSYSITQDPGVEGQNSIFHQALSMSPVQEDTMGFLPNIGNNGQYIYSNTVNSPLGRLMFNEGTTKRYRTGERRWPPRETFKRDAGICYNIPVNEPDSIWPRSIECQIQEGDCGDFWLLSGSTITVDGKTNAPANHTRMIKKKDAERSTGEWNTVEVISYNGRCVHIVNGVVVNVGENASTRSGKILLQSEYTEIYYRNILIREL